MDNLIFIDIETRRPQRQSVRDYVQANGKIDARLKDPAKIEAARDKLLADTSLNPMWGEVAVICMALADGKVATAGDLHGEQRTLSAALRWVTYRMQEKHGRLPHFVGFNVAFDLRFIWTRALVRGLKPQIPIPYDAKPWSGKYTDLRHVLTGGDSYAKGTLQDWVVALGGTPRENDIPGKDVPDAIEAGRMDEVIAHCEQDVRDCVWLYEQIYGREAEA